MERMYRQEVEDDGWRILDGVALPFDLAEELAQEEYERAERVREERQRQLQEHVAESETQFRATPVKRPSKCLSWQEPFRCWGGPTLKVLSAEDVDRDASAVDARIQEADEKRHKSALHKLIASRGEYRKLARVPDDWREQLDEIEAACPNFAEVIDYLRAMCALAELTDGVLRLDPMLLNGPPGVGKSLFAERMTRFLGSGFRRINMENAQTNAQLAGSDEFWSNSKGGAVQEVLVEGDWANPVFFVDEVDKANPGMTYDPIAALYGLLEPATAATFHDQSMPGIHLDASRIYWILTCNWAERVPEPIMSRVRRFDVPSPTPEQAVRILNNIFGELQVELKLPAPFDPLGKEIVVALVLVSPRRQRQLVREAIGRALFHGRHRIISADLCLPPEGEGREEEWVNEKEYYNGSETKKFGFC
ncbi:MAG: AAA family ATPase [Gallionella sp.]